MMRHKGHFFTGLTGLLGSSLIRNWMSTLEYKCALYDASVDPASPQCRGQKIYIFWHEYIPTPVFLRGHTRVTMLLSQHRDADLLFSMAHHLGYDCVRGSTTRGGAAAIRELMQKSSARHLAMTPDGPRGPRRKLAQGPIYLASKLGLPIVAMGFGYDRPWRLGSWDRFAIPKPFSRVRAVLSPDIHLPSDLDREGIEHYRYEVERLLNRMTLEAEAWAESGTRKVMEMPVRRERLLEADRAVSLTHRFQDNDVSTLPFDADRRRAA